MSESQRRWAFANKDKPGDEGKAAAEFAAADPGGKLPEHVKDGKAKKRTKVLYDHPRSRTKGYADGGEVKQTEADRDKALSDYLQFRRRRRVSTSDAEATPVEDEHAKGGKVTHVSGQPVGKDDGLIAAQKGEFVVRKSAVKKLGIKTMDEINKGRIPILYDRPISRKS